MKKTHSRLMYLLPLLCVATVCAQTQKTHAVVDFVINRNRPFVYLKIDHVGQGEPRSEDEPDTRVWLRLTNNCRVPIIVRTFGVPEGSPKYEQGVMYEVVANPPVFGGMQVYMPGPSTPHQPHGVTEPKEQSAPTQTESDETPSGYMFHVGSFQSLAPGEQVLFSVPANHFDTRWHIEIPIKFDLPKGKDSRDESIGGLPKMAVDYSLWDLSPQVRKKLEKK
jgi:hypothetical protein